MGATQKQEYAELLGREAGLEVHLQTNFYPPLPAYVRNDIVTAFKEHWNGELDCLVELTERCYLRNIEALYRYFDCYLNHDYEDLED